MNFNNMQTKVKKIENKKKKIISILIILLILLLLVVLIVGKTYSKYTDVISASAGAPVAKWSFLVNGEETTISEIKFEDIYNEESLINGKIAPGVNGSFDILIDATGSDVGVEYKIEFKNIYDEPENLDYTYEGTKVNSIKQLEPLLQGKIDANDPQKQKTITINWEWKYETGDTQKEITVRDKIDTDDSDFMNNFMFNINVTGTQERPTR